VSGVRCQEFDCGFWISDFKVIKKTSDKSIKGLREQKIEELRDLGIP
jgi:endogenous inhibitor of DNA gyrase (YacG/DUF329 family)